ncbi:hypothetical protein PLICRDRAFT_32995 [Plicaturopsis crispa FD-325 SS-3]|uniref:Unplaced genomic scaffold PLICRscaffold_26, whole genome shotgun sequence n=1 Tax=Plicaturopsis crispa FD-325 SS-3 TaxID=944288 RepID=A0A0C9SQ33_PLICR|nr:hypothetical protein PLICRDRAFT_32995 [Plicaturopsis crispa FD-325 SS-3]
MDAAAFTSFSTLVGVISGLAGILTFLYAIFFCSWHLPDAQYKQLQDTLRETEWYYERIGQAVPNGLVNELSSIQSEERRLHTRVHRAVSHLQQWMEFIWGLSIELYHLRYRARMLRARLTGFVQADERLVINTRQGSAVGPDPPLEVHRHIPPAMATGFPPKPYRFGRELKDPDSRRRRATAR